MQSHKPLLILAIIALCNAPLWARHGRLMQWKCSDVAGEASPPNPAFLDEKGAAVAEPFDLSQVRLLEGMFKNNQLLDEKFLLSLDPDRLLHNFRINAKLPSTATPYGGWEAPGSGLRGHFVGHYLSACAQIFADTGDQNFKDRGTLMVTELGKCQDALGTGYLSAFPVAIFDQIETKLGGGSSAPYYTVHKIMAGLLDQYHYCSNAQALGMACRMADYFKTRMDRLTPDQIDYVLYTSNKGTLHRHEFGGMSEVLHNLYAITRRSQYLSLADLFDRPWFVNALAMKQDDLAGLHANTHIPQVIGFARHYELTGDDQTRRAAEFFWTQVTQHHSYVTGSNSRGEVFLGPDVEANGLSDDTAETCNVYNMLKLTDHIFSWTPDVAVADYAERALYNHILSSIDPDSGALSYYLSLKPGHFKLFGTLDTAFWCCTGTGVENHARYGSSIYFHHDDTLWVNLFIPSRLTWAEKDLFLTQSTTFPESDQTTLTFAAARPTTLKLLLRYPSWATGGATVTVNGHEQAITVAPGSYIALEGRWSTGDRIIFHIPMCLRLHCAIDNPKVVSIMYGPVVLAGELGRDGMPPSDKSGDHRAFFKDRDPPVPALTGDSDKLDSWIRPVPGKPLNFITVNSAQPADIQLKPLYDIDHERFSIYWHFVDTAYVR